MNIVIDKAIPEDALSIQEIFHKTWLATYVSTEHGITTEHINEYFKDAYKPETLEKRKTQIAKMDEVYMIFTARVDGKVVGFVRVMKEKENNRLRAFYILPEFQGKGIGTKLFEKAREFFDLTLFTLVEVATYNTPAINFYKKMGFIDKGKRAEFKMDDGPIIPEMEMKRD
jgi:ribosomal protein S18 acetylase RimI-like enzyme